MTYKVIEVKPESDAWISHLKAAIRELAPTAESFQIEVNRMTNRIIVNTWFYEEIEGVRISFPERYIMIIKVRPPIQEPTVNHLADIVFLFLVHGIVKSMSEAVRIKISDPTFPTLQIIFP